MKNNFVIQRVHRNSDEEGRPIREVLAAGYGTKDNAVKAILDMLPEGAGYKLLDHSGNKRRRMVITGMDLFYEITEISDLMLLDDEPWDLPEQEVENGINSKG